MQHVVAINHPTSEHCGLYAADGSFCMYSRRGSRYPWVLTRNPLSRTRLSSTTYFIARQQMNRCEGIEAYIGAVVNSTRVVTNIKEAGKRSVRRCTFRRIYTSITENGQYRFRQDVQPI